jgi:hypothetical protein
VIFFSDIEFTMPVLESKKRKCLTDLEKENEEQSNRYICTCI